MVIGKVDLQTALHKAVGFTEHSLKYKEYTLGVFLDI